MEFPKGDYGNLKRNPEGSTNGVLWKSPFELRSALRLSSFLSYKRCEIQKLAKVPMHERTRVSTLKSGSVPQKEVHGGCSFSQTDNEVEPRFFMFVAKML